MLVSLKLNDLTAPISKEIYLETLQLIAYFPCVCMSAEMPCVGVDLRP